MSEISITQVKTWVSLSFTYMVVIIINKIRWPKKGFFRSHFCTIRQLRFGCWTLCQCVHFYLPIVLVTNGKPVKSLDKSNVGFDIFFSFSIKGWGNLLLMNLNMNHNLKPVQVKIGRIGRADYEQKYNNFLGVCWTLDKNYQILIRDGGTSKKKCGDTPIWLV